MQILINSSYLTWGLIAVAYLIIGINFLLYTFVLRHKKCYQEESTILFFQIKSISILTIIGILCFLGNPSPELFAGWIGSIFTHAIYSLLFLELWALSQGSFSLETLKHIESSGFDLNSQLILVELGNHKLTSRIMNLREGRLIFADEGHWKLTRKGRALYTLLKLIQTIPAIRNAG